MTHPADHVRFACPVCGQQQELPEELAASTAYCGQCGEVLKVPGDPAAVRRRKQAAARKERETAERKRQAAEAERFRKRMEAAPGCRRCGGHGFLRTARTSGAGVLVIVIGLLSACFTYGVGLLFCLLAFWCTDTVWRCNDCKYSWRE